ncbi:OLC1v1022425C2 [Oldenlandia corymbosa var. corymbosa]|uniref:OLC1v1022425C2 n=1 Tax=Oldenlandia corymbosa var. corymbosa TaxID=529605 RepID=A0AAV1BXT9_OLDCO|nr:OLC1v1022425C2 [Oldenlandia corymbosa var. corymbosa]
MSVSGGILATEEVPQGYITSLGKQPENPLVLLGQYSDDELDDGSSGEEKRVIPEDSLVLPDDSQGKVAGKQGNEERFNEGSNGAIETEKGPLLLDATLSPEAVGTAADVLDDNRFTGKTPAASTSDTEAGDMSSGWKIVWHEESNQYYYWNISTGETSWTVPEVLQAGGGSETANTGENEKAINVADATYPNIEMTEAGECKMRAETWGADSSKDHKFDPDAQQNHLESSPLATVQDHVGSPGNSDGVHIGEGESAKSFDSPKLGDGESNESRNLASCLIKQCEDLLEQLNSVKGSQYLLHGHVELHTLTVEVEMRLADMKSLACYKSSLLPFWQLSENRLQQLEVKITDVLRQLKSEKENEVASADLLPANSCREVDANSSEEKFVSALGSFHTPGPTGIADSHNNHETQNHQPTGDENVPSERHLTGYAVSGASEEDMDVDMEVEEATPSTYLDISVTTEQLSLPTSTVADSGISVLGKVYSVPPPPDEDWIPPPPPDDEPFPPPPPPDEPPEIPYSQPSDVVTVPSFPYMEQYNVYPSSHFQYAAQISSDVASANLYSPTEGCQPAVSQLPLFYGTVPATYNTATLGVAPADTGLYYGYQGSITQPLVLNSSSNSHGIVDTHGGLGSTLLPKDDGNPVKASLENSSAEAPLQSSSTTLLTESASLSSIATSTATISASTTAPKAQSKVTRNKKRTVAVVSSLRSNKKVSSLVDKWKAAKEELQEQEKEPENALEILERKRQREIEEWRKQQIASGEAKDNANFQPLGGDWRERVKRKRAKLAQESQSPSDGVSEVNNSQPDLGELSRGLPQGWQAFWDDSSKQVYYGNASTSETSWIRPTD